MYHMSQDRACETGSQQQCRNCNAVLPPHSLEQCRPHCNTARKTGRHRELCRSHRLQWHRQDQACEPGRAWSLVQCHGTRNYTHEPSLRCPSLLLLPRSTARPRQLPSSAVLRRSICCTVLTSQQRVQNRQCTCDWAPAMSVVVTRILLVPRVQAVSIVACQAAVVLMLDTDHGVDLL